MGCAVCWGGLVAAGSHLDLPHHPNQLKRPPSLRCMALRVHREYWAYS